MNCNCLSSAITRSTSTTGLQRDPHAPPDPPMIRRNVRGISKQTSTTGISSTSDYSILSPRNKSPPSSDTQLAIIHHRGRFYCYVAYPAGNFNQPHFVWPFVQVLLLSHVNPSGLQLLILPYIIIITINPRFNIIGPFRHVYFSIVHHNQPVISLF